jgi:phosphomannomutase
MMSQAHQFDQTILREYDIRGIVGKTLNAADAKAVGQSFGTVVKRAGGNHVCVGYDGRHSSPELAAAMVEGLLSTGVNVTSVLALAPHRCCISSVKHTGADAGVMITGSHNPPEYNGIKMLHKGPVYGEPPFWKSAGCRLPLAIWSRGKVPPADLDVQGALCGHAC